MKILHVVGARPNFIKAAPVIAALSNRDSVTQALVHTGQHYDDNMSEVFFRQLDIPEPDINLGVGSASHAVQTARIMERFEKVCLDIQPDMVMVVGEILKGNGKKGKIPYLWDGNAAGRMVEVLGRILPSADFAD